MLLDQSTWHGLAYWNGWGQAFKGVLLIKRGDPTGLQALASALAEEFPGTSAARRHVAFLGELADVVGHGRLPLR